MSTGWNTSWYGVGSPAGTVDLNSPAKGEVINRARNDLILLGAIRQKYDTDRSSRGTAMMSALADTYADHPEYDDYTIDWDKLISSQGVDGEWVVKYEFECKTDDVTTSLTPRVVLAGTSTLVGSAGAAHSLVTWGAQFITIPESTGIKTYRPQFKQSNLSYTVRCISRIWLYAPEPTV